MEGWIKLHRKITKWEWYDDGNTFRLFMHLLLMANHKDGSWHGIPVNRGQFITGRKKLAKALKLGEQQIRTSLERLQLTSEVTIEATSKYSIITIVNYNAYNDKETCNNQQSTETATNNQPSSNQQVTTNNNDNNEKNEKEEKNFSEFFLACPARNGKRTERKQTKINYLREAIKDRPAILAAAKNYANCKQAKEGYAKDPKRFLANWRDWITPEKGTTITTTDLSKNDIRTAMADMIEKEKKGNETAISK